MTKPNPVYVSDFETTVNVNDCRVWLWGLFELGSHKFVHGTSIEHFVNRISWQNSTVYFHNLGFDGFFILDWLMNNGFVHTTDSYRLTHLTFSTVIDNSAKWYEVRVRWATGKITTFRDSLKKLPMRVADVADAFKLPIAKGDIDFHLERPVGYKPTDIEVEYVKIDCAIVALALEQQFEQGMRRMTVGSDSLFEFTTLTGGKKLFERVFPVLPIGIDADIRHAYRGGFTFVNPKHQGHITRGGRVYDVNSLYPYIMQERILPYGHPVPCEGLPTVDALHPLFVVSVTFRARLRPGMIPCIQVKNSPHFAATQYQNIIEEPVTLFATNVDLALWEEHYDMDILSYNGGYKFKGTKGLFDRFIDKWGEVKRNADGGLRTIAKLFLNSLYGKFATNPDVTGKVPVLENGVVQLRRGPDESRNPVYTAMGVFITAWARDLTIRAAQQHYDVFAYADTDSLHLLVDNDPETLTIDKHAMGAWKRELVFERALFARAKCYTEYAEGEYHTHIAGLPSKVSDKVTFDSFLKQTTFNGKLVPKRVPGGVVLTETTFTINLEQTPSTLNQ